MLCGFFKATPAVQFRLAYRNYFQTLSSFSSQNYHTSHIRECSEDSTSYFGGLLCTSQKPPKHEETVALLHYYLLVLINIVKMKWNYFKCKVRACVRAWESIFHWPCSHRRWSAPGCGAWPHLVVARWVALAHGALRPPPPAVAVTCV